MERIWRQGGFSLIETAIAMIVMALLFVPLLHFYAEYKNEQFRTRTIGSLTAAQEALVVFLLQHGHYPCPASLTAPYGSALDGMETDCAEQDVPLGTCVDGICIQPGARTLEEIIEPRIHLGTLPYVALDLPARSAYDGYGGRLFYAVTEHMATREGYQPNTGAIDIVSSSETSLLKIQGSADFVVFSAGENRAGAFNREGSQMLPCDGGLDALNCTFTKPQAAYRLAPYSTSGNAHHYDDYITYYISMDRERTPYEKAAFSCPDGEFIRGVSRDTGPICGVITKPE